MRDIAVVVENVSKKYLIGTGKSGSIRETVVKTFNGKLGKSYRKQEEFWALQDISFKLQNGEALGVIGKNGAGKSTLLKILSKITYPTKGSFITNGRVSSLLEVGTGFHPELTGKENIFLNGTILGMSRNEVKKKFDEIVNFSEVERFLDTPVKRYSSGMYVRLAFAVAAHLEPEVLIIDEVLAVGDAEFQKKCLGKMNDVTKTGRTVVFVSHNMEAIKNLCSSAFLLEHGRIVEKGNVDVVVNKYLSQQTKNVLNVSWQDIETAPGNDKVLLIEASVNSSNPTDKTIFTTDYDIILVFKFINKVEGKNNIDIAFHLSDENGNLLFMSNSCFVNEKYFNTGEITGTCIIPRNLLNEGTYTIEKLHFVKNRGNILFELNDVLSFEVHKPLSGSFGFMGGKQGLIKPILDWQLKYNKH